MPQPLRACLSVRFQGFTPSPQYRPSASSRLWPARPAALCLPDPCRLGSDSHGGEVFSGKLLEFLTQTGSKTGRANLGEDRRRISMDVETAIQAFASAGHDPPRDVMQWALDHWDEVAPGLLNVLERFVSGADRSNDTASTVFFILHLAGEKQDTRVFPLLCSLAQDGEAIEAALGDGTAATLKQILISTYDGDLDTLTGLIEAV